MKPKLQLPLVSGLAICACILAAIPVAVPAFAQSEAVPMVGNLAKGEWTVRYRDGTPDLRVCLRTGRELIQLRHRRSDCSRFVVEEAVNRVTVQYTCPGNGYGRTNIRRETNDLVQIESQGIAAGQPFQFAAEARRTGRC